MIKLAKIQYIISNNRIPVVLCFLITVSLVLPAAVCYGSQLDDQIAAFKTAPEKQSESTVVSVLKSGLTENRCVEAFTVVRPWLARKQPQTQAGLFNAGRVAQYAGYWSAATDFYKALLHKNNLDSEMAGVAVGELYRVMLSYMGEPESAYFYMRQQGNRLREYGKAKHCDRWFLTEAKQRKDLVAVCDRLSSIYSSSADNHQLYIDDLEWACGQLESFNGKAITDEQCDAALRLASVPRVGAVYIARLKWVAAVIPYNRKLDELRNTNIKKVDPALTDKAIAAAEQLLQAAPDKGAFLVANGWGVEYDHGGSGNCGRRFGVEKERKLAQLLAVIPRMSPDKRDDILAHPMAKGQVKFDSAVVRKLVMQYPGMLNTLTAADVPLFDKSLTVEEAKILAPQLARNPHIHAAIVRMVAIAGDIKFSSIIAALDKSEIWRFDDAKQVIHAVWNWGSERDADYNKTLKRYSKMDASYELMKKQIGKKAPSKERFATYILLQKDLLSPQPSIAGALGLFDKAFENAPDVDKIVMLKSLLSGFDAEREYLIKRALGKALFGGNNRLPLTPVLESNYHKYHHAPIVKTLPSVAAELQKMLDTQMKTGKISETIFAMWLYSVDPEKAEAVAMMKSLVVSPAYQTIDKRYHKTAAENYLFDYEALTPELGAMDSRYVSRELLTLTKDPEPAAVAEALAKVVTRVSKLPVPVAVIGLHPVAALKKMNEQTLTYVLELFNGSAPLGGYPEGQGYEELVMRLVSDMRKSNQWGMIEPYAAPFWRGAAAAGYQSHFAGAEELTGFAEAAIEAGNPSVAISVGRIGLKMGGRPLDKNDIRTGGNKRLVRLSTLVGSASIAIGVVEIPVAENDPAYGIYKSNMEFVLGNQETAWKFYESNSDQLLPIVRKLSVEYGFWLLRQMIDKSRSTDADVLIKEMTIWSRQEEGAFSSEQSAELKIIYADLAFQNGALPTARAWYQKVADAREYRGSAVYVSALLGMAKVDRVTKNFDSAMTELDKLMQVRGHDARMHAHHARAQVFVDQENFADAFNEIDAVLRYDANHSDALILKGKAQIHMRKLVDATEIPVGPRLDEKIIVPGETIKINLNDPGLNVSGVGADIEVEIRAESGDVERVMLHQLGDNKEKFRAEVPTALAAPIPNDKVLQVLGRDKIRYGYSKQFRNKMKDLPPDPDVDIGVASDARLDITSGVFPPKAGERRLDIEELGLSTAQKALGMRTVRPGNPFYIRVIDPDQSRTHGIDEVVVSVESSSGDTVAQMTLTETGTHTGEFTGELPTAPAQAMAMASESAPGREANMAISSKDYPGWVAKTGSKADEVVFTVDLNDDVPLDKMTVNCGEADRIPVSFVLQTSMNGIDWVSRARYPEGPAPWDGSPRVSLFPTYGRGFMPVSVPDSRRLPEEWDKIMDVSSASKWVNYTAATVKNLEGISLPPVDGGHPGYSVLMKYRAVFYQPSAEIRRFQLTGYPETDSKGNRQTIFIIDGEPADEDSEDAMLIERELAPGLHEIQVWRHEGQSDLNKRKPVLLCNKGGNSELVPCPDGMFAPTTFPEFVRKKIDMPATIHKSSIDDAVLEIAFAENTRGRLVRMVIVDKKGVAPAIKKITMTDRDGKVRLPVKQDYQQLRDNMQLEVLPGDRIFVRYQDDKSATKNRTRHGKNLSVAYNTATIQISFLNYMTTDKERVLVLEDIRRFGLNDSIAVIINDPDMDSSSKKDVIEFTVNTSNGSAATVKAVETEEHSGEFHGRIFPVFTAPQRDSDIRVTEGATLTATYRDMENLDPGIPTDRSVTIEHAKFTTPEIAVYNITSKPLPPVMPDKDNSKDDDNDKGPEIILPRYELSYEYVDQEKLKTTDLQGVIGASLCFDVIVPHLALAKSSTISAYVQTDAGRKASKEQLTAGYDLQALGTLKLDANPSRAAAKVPACYELAHSPTAPSSKPPLDEGRFSFSVPLILGEMPSRSFAVNTESLTGSSMPEGLVVRGGDVVHIGFAYKDNQGNPHWQTADVKVTSHAILDVMNSSYRKLLTNAYVGEKVYIRLLAPGLDQQDGRDHSSVFLKASSGSAANFQVRETEPHSGIFRGVFTLGFADKQVPAKLPPVELNGFPVRYGDNITISYEPQDVPKPDTRQVVVNMGADGGVEPFSKRFAQDEMAVKTHFTLAECFFELAKQHKKMGQESLARREMGHAQKLLAEAIASHRDDEMKAHAEYLLGNLSQEYADLSKNEQSKLSLYQDALSRFSRIPLDYPDSEFAPKAQFKTALVYEKMGEIDISVEEYVKLAYKYPDCEYIAEVMARLGGYFQKRGIDFKDKATTMKDKEDDESKASVIRLMTQAKTEFHKAAMVFTKLERRFPDDELAGLSGLRAAQNFMRAEEYKDAIAGFIKVIENEGYDGKDIRAQAIYWCGLSHERSDVRGGSYEAYKLYNRVRLDFPDSKWAKHARGRLADPVFESIIEKEKLERERMLEALKNSRQ